MLYNIIDAIILFRAVAENEKRQWEEKAERQRILQIIEDNKRIEQEQKAKVKQNSLQYQRGTGTSQLYQWVLISVADIARS